MTEPLLVTAAKAEVVHVFGGDIHLTMPQGLTQARVSIVEDVRRPGDGPPLHVHANEDEIFRVIEGRFRFRVAEATFEAGPGDTAFLPRAVPHCFVNAGGTTGRLLVVLEPGGFERFFLDVVAEQLEVPADMARIAELAGRYGLRFLGPNPLIGH